MLATYHQTPHPSTGIPPANFIFRDGVKTSSGSDLAQSRKQDLHSKKSTQDKVNRSKYARHEQISRGDLVLARNVVRRSKFEPIFLPDHFGVVDMDADAKRVVLEGLDDSKLVVRHFDDVKGCHRELEVDDAIPDEFPKQFVDADESQNVETKVVCDTPTHLRRSGRERSAPAKYPEGEWAT